MIIAIDGPAGSGKSSTARAVARELGFTHLDSGAFYRALTYAALQAGIPVEGWDQLDAVRLDALGVSAEPAANGFRMLAAGRDVSAEIRAPDVTAGVAAMARVPAVRAWLLDQLRQVARSNDVVADGRDIGTVVFPDAGLKVFLVAEVRTRARRRLLQMGLPADDEAVAAEVRRIEERDLVDSSRAVAPLRAAADAVPLDTTGLDFDEQVARIVDLARQRTADSVHVSAYGMSDTGQRRADNQDNLLIADLSVSADEGGYALSADAAAEAQSGRFAVGARGVLLLVADGMGGAAAGAVASAMAVAEIHARMVTDWSGDAEGAHHRFALRLRQSLEVANARLFAHAQAEPECRGMGTTVTAAGVLGDCIYFAQVGDSRAYLVRGGAAVQLTRDQSYVQELIDAGRMTEEEAERSEHANKILQALGAAPTVTVVLTYQQLRRGDVIVLCSDGLSRVVQSAEIGAAASGMTDPAALCLALVDLANERGGPDNITVVAAAFDGPGLAEPAAREVVTRSVYDFPDLA